MGSENLKSLGNLHLFELVNRHFNSIKKHLEL